ncbi:MAG: HpcH/HpaI aldolase/citrate lyase family protein, partial [Nitrospinota bacterium]
VGAAEDADLIRDLGGRWTAEGRSLLYARSKVLLEARAAGLAHALDGVYMRLDDEAGLREDALLARELGYSGKTAIHPRQVPVINEVFTPSEEEAAYYREMLAAHEAGERQGRGAVNFRGKMIDAAMAAHARRVLALAEAIEKGGRA